MNGDFRKLFPSSDTTFVYAHDHHVNCSVVAYSQLVKFWNTVQQIDLLKDSEKFPKCDLHTYHDLLQPCFLSNSAFSCYLKQQIDECSEPMESFDKCQTVQKYY